MKKLADIWKFAFGKEEPVPPGPYEIALTFATALLSSGRFGEDPSAAMDTAWTLVIPFYQGQVAYGKHVGALFDMTRHASEPEPDMTQAEARAYVAGETGSYGEFNDPSNVAETMKVTIPVLDVEQQRARALNIHQCGLRVQAAAQRRVDAEAWGGADEIQAALVEWNAAIAAQSKSYE